ncbi:MAG: tetrahydrofolate dehydrogenase/cyclohydrolase catalytic domain-containing protein [Thermoplasmata archaeon]
MTERLDGKPVAGALLEDGRRRVEAGARAGRRPPMLVSVHRDDPTSPFSVYLRRQSRTAALAGVGFRDLGIARDADATTLRTRLAELDADPNVDAVLVEHPLPPALDFLGAVASLRPEKDVDGVGPSSLGHLLAGRPIHAPAVAVGAIALARHYGIRLSGQRVAVIGRSATVGLPLALLLLTKGAGGDATVTVAHSATPHLAQVLDGSEIIFSCAGRPGLLGRSNVPRGATVIDVGLSTVADPSAPSGVRMAGDADAAALEGWASALTPVPGGVGPVTVARLMSNAVDAWERLAGSLR